MQDRAKKKWMEHEIDKEEGSGKCKELSVNKKVMQARR